MGAAFKTAEKSQELVASEDLFLTSEFVTKGDITIVAGKDPRAAILLARKGTSIEATTLKKLGGDASRLKISETQEARTVAPEQIASRTTRPEKPAAER